MKVRVVSGRSSSKAPHMSSTYFGAKLVTVGSPGLNVNADRNSILFKGRLANAIQLNIHLIRSTDRGSS
jgi:hypothetical protein